ncbi:hypothetical protein GGI07_005512, partial [Coemansia sp. Benny D115]
MDIDHHTEEHGSQDAEMTDVSPDLAAAASESSATTNSSWTAIPKVGFSVHTSEENDYVDT